MTERFSHVDIWSRAAYISVMTERFGQWRMAMLQQIKSGDASRLTVVPAGALENQPMGRDLPDGRGPSPQGSGASTAKTSAIGALKANRRRIMIGVAAAVLVAAGWFGYDYMAAGRFLVSTDDAYVRANNTTLGAKVSGY